MLNFEKINCCKTLKNRVLWEIGDFKGVSMMGRVVPFFSYLPSDGSLMRLLEESSFVWRMCR